MKIEEYFRSFVKIIAEADEELAKVYEKDLDNLISQLPPELVLSDVDKRQINAIVLLGWHLLCYIMASWSRHFAKQKKMKEAKIFSLATFLIRQTITHQSPEEIEKILRERGIIK